jgi:hypothetical protein
MIGYSSLLKSGVLKIRNNGGSCDCAWRKYDPAEEEMKEARRSPRAPLLGAMTKLAISKSWVSKSGKKKLAISK